MRQIELINSSPCSEQEMKEGENSVSLLLFLINPIFFFDIEFSIIRGEFMQSFWHELMKQCVCRKAKQPARGITMDYLGDDMEIRESRCHMTTYFPYIQLLIGSNVISLDLKWNKPENTFQTMTLRISLFKPIQGILRPESIHNFLPNFCTIFHICIHKIFPNLFHIFFFTIFCRDFSKKSWFS